MATIIMSNNIVSIEGSAFSGCSKLTDVYFLGTKEEKERISIGANNAYLTKREWHFLPAQSVYLSSLPNKMIYELGDELDMTGARITAVYNEQIEVTTPIVPEMVSGFDSSEYGIKELLITYKGFSVSLEISVSHVPGEKIHENVIPSTCISEGSYDEVVYCTVCGEVLSCEHIITEINPSAHNPSDHVYENNVLPTCTEDGHYEDVVYCTLCLSELNREEVIVPALGHEPGDPVHENEVAPTFTEEGHYDEVVYCTVCHAELSRETVSTGRLPFEGTITWNANDVKFKGTTAYVIANGKAQTPRFTLKDKNGNVINPANYDYEYRENTKAGTGYVFVTLKGDYTGQCRGNFKIYLPATTETTVENAAHGIYLTWKPVTGAAGYVIYRRAWSSTTNGWTDFVRWNNTTDLYWTDTNVYAGTRYQYGIKAYFARRTDPMTGVQIGGNVGDNYNLGEVGPLKTTVRITTRDLNTLVAGNAQITANWSGAGIFTGYQIKYATNAQFTKNVKTVKIANPKTYSTALKSLQNGTTYYVAVRSYHIFNGMTYFGQWSNVLCVKPGSGMIVSPTHYRALLIGNNNYSSSPLYGCINDVNAMSGMLNRLSMPYTGTVVKNARRETIISQIRSTFAGATDSDVSLFYYSGHGVNAGGSGVNQGALVGTDGGFVTMKELAAELSKFRGRVIVILDSCHSGASIGKSDNTIDALDAFNREVIEAFSGYELETGDTAYSAKSGELKQSKFIVLTAASMSQSSFDGSFDGSGYRQGAFTAAIVKGMGFAYPNGGYAVPLCFPADTNGDRKVTLKELYTYTYNTAYNWTYNSGSPQRAQYYGNDSEVVFSR